MNEHLVKLLLEFRFIKLLINYVNKVKETGNEAIIRKIYGYHPNDD